MEVKETLHPKPGTDAYHRARLTSRGEPLDLEQKLMFPVFKPQDWVVAVGVEEAIENSAQGHPRS